MSDVYMRILLSASQGNTLSTINSVASALGKSGLGGALLGIGVAAGAAAVGIGIASVKAAGDFQQAMLSLVAHAGLAKDQVSSISQAVLDMAPIVGRSPTQLAEALYPILSAFSGIQDEGAKSAIALQTLKNSFETVAGTTVDGTAVANAAVGTFNALGLSTNNVATNTERMNNLFDVMDKTVQLGNMQWDQYKNVISKVAVSIQGTGISFNEASAALAEMTNEGFSAQKAQTYLSNTFTTIAIKTDALSKHAKALGISFDESKYGPMSLADKIQYLNDITDGNKQKLLALMGGNSTALKTFNALSVGLDGYKSNLDALNHSQGALASSFDTASSGFNFAMQKLQAAGQVLLITLGEKLLPVVSQIVTAVVPLVASFSQILSSTSPLSPIFQNIAGMFGIMAYNWGVFVTSAAPAIKAIQQFGGLLKEVLIGNISQTLRAINLLWLAFLTIASGVSSFVAPLLQILGQVLLGIQHAVEPVLNAIEGRLLPALQHLVSVVAPIVAAILQWIAASGAIPVIFQIIGFVLAAVVNIISFAINVIADIISWLAQFRTILLIIGAILLVVFAPVVATIAAVTAIIIILVKNWGAILAWLQGVWSAFASWFMGILQNIGSFFVSIWSDISNFFVGIWNDVSSFFVSIWSDIASFFTSTINGIKNAAVDIFNGIVNFFVGVWNGIVNIFQGGIQNIVNWFSWLYNHNYYFKDLVDFIRNVVTTVINWLKMAWQTVVNFVVGLWHTLSTTATTVWNAITGAINTAVSAVTGALKTAWNTVIGWLTAAWNAIAGVATTAWNAVSSAVQSGFNTAIGFVKGIWTNISGVFSSAYTTYIATPLASVWTNVSSAVSGAWTSISKAFATLWTSISGWFSGLATDALQWGANIINSIGTGIKNAVGGIKNAVSSVASTISGWLGFHSPTKEGPGRELDSWPKNMMASYSKGLVAAIPQLQSSLNLIMRPVASALTGQSMPSPSSGFVSSSGASNSTAPQPLVINVTVNGVVGNKQELVAYIMKEMNQQLRSSGRLSPTSSGGKAV
jgi:TP901 family phage tail tape measure protein